MSDSSDSSSDGLSSNNTYLQNIRDTAYLSRVSDETRNQALLLGLSLTLFALLMAEHNLIHYTYRAMFAVMAVFICVISLCKIYMIFLFIKNVEKTSDNKNIFGDGRSTYFTVLAIIAIFNAMLIVTITGYCCVRFSDLQQKGTALRERLNNAPTLRKLITKANRGD